MDVDSLLKEFNATRKRKIELQEEISKELNIVQLCDERITDKKQQIHQMLSEKIKENKQAVTKYNEELDNIKRRKIQQEGESLSIDNGNINQQLFKS